MNEFRFTKDEASIELVLSLFWDLEERDLKFVAENSQNVHLCSKNYDFSVLVHKIFVIWFHQFIEVWVAKIYWVQLLFFQKLFERENVLLA